MAQHKMWGIDQIMQQGNGASDRSMPPAKCITASHDCFCTGSLDGSVKVWDAPSGQLKATLAGGHGTQVRGLAVSLTSPHHLYSGAQPDPLVHCWDLEYGMVVRSFNTFPGGVRCLAHEPALNILVAAGGNSGECRIWDVRTHGTHVLTLSGHTGFVLSIVAQPSQPHIVTGSADSTIRLWDLTSGESVSTISSHRKVVRALAIPPSQQGHAIASASLSGIKTFTLPGGSPHHSYGTPNSRAIGLAINQQDVMVSLEIGSSSLWFWDYNTGHNFQKVNSSMDDEIWALSFDITGTRLVTCGRNGAITMWKEQNHEPQLNWEALNINNHSAH